MNLADELENSVEERLGLSPLPDGCDGEEIDIVGRTTYSDLCRFIAEGRSPETISASVEGGVDLDVLPVVTALAALIAAAKNLYELYEKLAERRARKPTQAEFEEEAANKADKTLISIVYIRESQRK